MANVEDSICKGNPIKLRLPTALNALFQALFSVLQSWKQNMVIANTQLRGVANHKKGEWPLKEMSHRKS